MHSLKLTRQPLSLFIALITCTTPAVADTREITTSDNLETLQVWGTQVKASSIAILDKDTLLMKQPDHISDLLRIIPGVDVGGAHSLNQRITIRSMDDKDLRISIDGANQNTYMYHHMGNLQIHADILESAEIEVGNNSVINGGLGGAVRFKTKDVSSLLATGAEFGGRVQASYADNSGDSVALTGYGQLTDSLDALVYINQVNRDNYKVGGGKIVAGDGSVIANTDGKVRGLEGEITDALVKLGWDRSNGHRVKLGYENYTDKGDYSYRPDMGLATDLAIANSLHIPLTYPTEFSRDTATLNYTGDLSANTSLEASLYRNESRFWRDERGLVSWSPASATINQGDANNTGINIFLNSSLGADVNHALTYGLDYIEHNTAFSANRERRSGEESSNSAVFLEDNITTPAGINFIPGLRYESVDVDSNLVNKTYDKLTAAFAAEYQANDDLLFRISATELFRAPELAEVFIGAGGDDTPNGEVKAETGINQQLSFAYQKDIFAADNVSLGVTLFQTEIDDHIYDYANNPAGGYWKDNVGDMEIKGYEAYIGYDLNGFSALLTYSEAESELNAFDQYRQFDNARIDRQQGDTVSLALDYRFSQLNLSLHWDTLYVDDLPAGPDLDGATLENAKDGFIVSNVSAHWKSGTGFDFTLGVDNLFDEFYASQSSRTGISAHPRFGNLFLMDYEPGRNIKLSASYNF